MSLPIVDLSIPCNNRSPGISISLKNNLPVYAGHECYAYDLGIQSHHGTYFETSSHLFREGKNTHDIPLEKLILPGICLRMGRGKRCIDAKDLQKAAKEVKIKSGSALLLYTQDNPAEDFIYFSLDAAMWMIEKKVALMGSDTRRYDRGFKNPTGFFVDLFKAEIPIIANIINLEKLPQSGFTLYVFPLNIIGICTVPCRVIAVMDGGDTIE